MTYFLQNLAFNSIQSPLYPWILSLKSHFKRQFHFIGFRMPFFLLRLPVLMKNNEF